MGQILPNLAAELEAAKAENAKLLAALAAASKPRAITLKVGQSGGLSVYGLGRYPVTLYKSQWVKLLAETDAIRAFLKANDSLLADKS